MVVSGDFYYVGSQTIQLASPRMLILLTGSRREGFTDMGDGTLDRYSTVLCQRKANIILRDEKGSSKGGSASNGLGTSGNRK
jgi:hypothetical protein